MKLIILLCVFCISQAITIEKMNKIASKSLKPFKEAMDKYGTIEVVTGIEDESLKKLSDDTKNYFTNNLKHTLADIIQIFKLDHEHVRNISDMILSESIEIKTALSTMKDDEISKEQQMKYLRYVTRDLINQILEKYEIGRRNPDLQMDFNAKFQLGDVMIEAKEKVLENSNSLKAYIISIDTSNEILKQIFNLVNELSDEEFKELLDFTLVSSRTREAQSTTLFEENTKKFWKRLDINVQHKAKRLLGWVKEAWANSFEAIKQKVNRMMGMNMEMISGEKNVIEDKINKALEVFSPHEKELGKFWAQLKDLIEDALGKF